LSGDGGDELFYGYTRYASAESVRRHISRLPPSARRLGAVALKALPPALIDVTFSRLTVNSTVACSLVAKKLQIDVAHVEAGLRSGDREMPEEINRIVTDSISDWFFVTETSGLDNLKREGHEVERIHLVGNVMIDNLFYQQRRLESQPPNEQTETLRAQLGQRYGVVTLHRPSNVDDESTIRSILSGIGKVAERVPLVFAVHPRTSAMLERCGIDVPPRVYLSPPLPYMAFLSLWSRSTLVITDSGGLQEETTALGIPCITVRENTERPITLTEGTNVMVGRDPARIVEEAFRVLDGHGKVGRRPALWDGHAAERIVEVLERGYILPRRTIS
jgi:UDP-N-acetylglucosamine 2-epimerase (non-hydrolysing)